MTKITLIVVCGATASGKTGLAIELAKKFNGEIVSADSMQIYKYMDIGTAKPTKDERTQAVHHMIDFIDPSKSYSVADYTEDAHKCIADIISRNKMPILCGGTGLYINSVVNDVDFTDAEGDSKIRNELYELAKNEGQERLYEILREIDPESAKIIHANNIKRVVRAIEFYKLTGTKISEHKEESLKKDSRYAPIMMMIDHDRQKLYDRINYRVELMMRDGLIDEVKKLQSMGYTRDMQSMQGIGYKELLDYLNNEIGYDTAIEAIKQGSRRYAKRQLTWFRRDDRINCIDAEKDVIGIAEYIVRNNITQA